MGWMQDVSDAAIQRLGGWVGSGIRSAEVAAGDLNLPRAMFTEKAFVEDELVVTSAVALDRLGAVASKLIWEKRLGKRTQIEVILPYQVLEAENGSWSAASPASSSPPPTRRAASGSTSRCATLAIAETSLEYGRRPCSRGRLALSTEQLRAPDTDKHFGRAATEPLAPEEITMSVEKLANIIRDARADGFVSLDEMGAITSRKDSWLKSPESVGSFFDSQEHKVLRGLYTDIVDGKVKAQGLSLLEPLALAPESRVEHAAECAWSVSSTVMRWASVPAALLWGALSWTTMGGVVLAAAAAGAVYGAVDD